MKAIVLREFGGPDALRLEEVPKPTPTPDEVLVQVHSVSVNRTLDLNVRQGEYRSNIKLPLVLGVDPSGVVVEAGSDVNQSRIGDRVAIFSSIRCSTCSFCEAGEEDVCSYTTHIGLDRWGGYAEYVAVPAGNTTLIPPKLSFAEATVITRHVPTAFNLLENKADLKAGEWVLVMGAAGGLGSSGVQVGKFLGAKVIAGAGSDERVAAALSYGADFGINYRRENLEQGVLRITKGRGVDVVFENIADPTLWPGSFNSLAHAGRMVTAGAHGGGKVTLNVQQLYLRRLRIIGAPGSHFRDVERSLEAAASGKIRACIDRVMPLREAATAHRLIEDNQTLGKIILDPTLD